MATSQKVASISASPIQYHRGIKWLRKVMRNTMHVDELDNRQYAIGPLTVAEFNRVMELIRTLDLIIELFAYGSSFPHPAYRLWADPVHHHLIFGKIPLPDQHPLLLFVIHPGHCPPASIKLPCNQLSDNDAVYEAMFKFFGPLVSAPKNLEKLKRYQLELPQDFGHYIY